MAKICSLCLTNGSWRYHSIPTAYNKLIKLVEEHFLNPTHSHFANSSMLCNACHGSVGRMCGFIDKLKENRSDIENSPVLYSTSNSSNEILTDLEETRDLQSSSIHSNEILTDLEETRVLQSSGIQCNNLDHSYGLTTSAIKRPYFSDHTYDGSTDTRLYGQEDPSTDITIDTSSSKKLDIVGKYISEEQTESYITYQSILKTKTLDDLTEEDLICEIITEMDERCSELLKLLLNIAVKQKTDLGIRHLASIAVAYASVMFTRDNHNSALQRVITLMAVEGNCNDEFIRRLNRMSLTLSCTGKIKLLDRAANSNRSKLVQCVKDNPMVKITGDNLDMYIRTNHQRQDNQNKDIHWFASNLVASRIDYSNISNESPNIAVEDIAPETFLPNDAEKQHISNVKKVIIGRVISDSEKFDWLKKTLPAHIPNSCSGYMSKKQEVFGLPVLFKNEAKNEDCQDIMKNLEKEIINIFNEAYGNLDVLNNYGIVLGGDQLTRERLQNVKNISHLAMTPEGRFEHLQPIVCELWHVKQDLLSKAYKALYKNKSFEKGTLYQIKIILRRTDVTGKVKSNYKAHEDLFLLMVKALLLVATDDIKEDIRDRDAVLSKIYSKIHGEGCGSDDYVLNYFVNIMFWGLQILNMNDTAKEGDVDRVLINCKENIPLFYGHSKMSKYFTEMVNLILMCNHLLSPVMRLRVLEGAFINTAGGHGKNKEADLVQENSIRNKKDLIRSLGANKTEKAVLRSCAAADMCQRIGHQTDKALDIPKLSAAHTKKSSAKDLDTLVKILREVKPFLYQKGRQFSSFPKIPKNPNAIVRRDDLLKALEKKIFRLYLNC